MIQLTKGTWCPVLSFASYGKPGPLPNQPPKNLAFEFSCMDSPPAKRHVSCSCLSHRNHPQYFSRVASKMFYRKIYRYPWRKGVWGPYGQITLEKSTCYALPSKMHHAWHGMLMARRSLAGKPPPPKYKNVLIVHFTFRLGRTLVGCSVASI